MKNKAEVINSTVPKQKAQEPFKGLNNPEVRKLNEVYEQYERKYHQPIKYTAGDAVRLSDAHRPLFKDRDWFDSTISENKRVVMDMIANLQWELKAYSMARTILEITDDFINESGGLAAPTSAEIHERLPGVPVEEIDGYLIYLTDWELLEVCERGPLQGAEQQGSTSADMPLVSHVGVHEPSTSALPQETQYNGLPHIIGEENEKQNY